MWNLKFTWAGDAGTNPGATDINFTVQATPVDMVRSRDDSLLVFRPNPIGIGHTFAEWHGLHPVKHFQAIHSRRPFTFTKPDGTTYIKGLLSLFPMGRHILNMCPTKSVIGPSSSPSLETYTRHLVPPENNHLRYSRNQYLDTHKLHFQPQPGTFQGFQTIKNGP